jgi:hypothetical protein
MSKTLARRAAHVPRCARAWAETAAVGCGTITKRGDWWHFRWTDESGQPLHRTLALVLFVIN